MGNVTPVELSWARIRGRERFGFEALLEQNEIASFQRPKAGSVGTG